VCGADYFNIRGVKESIVVMAPILWSLSFTRVFVVPMASSRIPIAFAPLADSFQAGIQQDVSTIGFIGILMLFRCGPDSLGGGTYTGIEAVSKRHADHAEPRCRPASGQWLYGGLPCLHRGRTVSVLCASGCKTEWKARRMNAVIADNLFAGWGMGKAIAFITIFFRGALLLVAAQTGFVDGPRVMAK